MLAVNHPLPLSLVLSQICPFFFLSFFSLRYSKNFIVNRERGGGVGGGGIAISDFFLLPLDTCDNMNVKEEGTNIRTENFNGGLKIE